MGSIAKQTAFPAPEGRRVLFLGGERVEAAEQPEPHEGGREHPGYCANRALTGNSANRRTPGHGTLIRGVCQSLQFACEFSMFGKINIFQT